LGAGSGEQGRAECRMPAAECRVSGRTAAPHVADRPLRRFAHARRRVVLGLRGKRAAVCASLSGARRIVARTRGAVSRTRGRVAGTPGRVASTRGKVSGTLDRASRTRERGSSTLEALPGTLGRAPSPLGRASRTLEIVPHVRRTPSARVLSTQTRFGVRAHTVRLTLFATTTATRDHPAPPRSLRPSPQSPRCADRGIRGGRFASWRLCGEECSTGGVERAQFVMARSTPGSRRGLLSRDVTTSR
jgi:hypothetical protein